MAIAYVGGAGNGVTSGNSVSVTHGQTISSGDVVIALVGMNNGSATCTSNNGAYTFTEEYDGKPGSPAMTSAIYSRVAGASEPSSYTFDCSTTTAMGVVILVFSGVDNSTLFDVDPTSQTWGAGTSSSAVAATMTTSTTNTFGVAWFVAQSGDVTFDSIDNSYGNEVEPNTGLMVAAYSRAIASSGSVGATTCTLASSKNYVAIQFALNPGAGAKTASGTPSLSTATASGSATIATSVVITDVNTTESWADGASGVVITGTGFV